MKNKTLGIVIVISIISITSASYLFLSRGQSNKWLQATTEEESQKTGQEFQPSPISEQTQLYFIKPKGSIVATPGETVEVQLNGSGVSEVLLMGPNFLETIKADGSNIFKFKYIVPVEAIGNVRLIAMGKTNDNLPIQPVELNIDISLALAGKINSITVSNTVNEQIFMVAGSTWPLSVYGTYSDGIKREITTDSGIEYTLWPGQPANSEIIRIDNKGVITAISPGQRSIIINHKNRSSTATAASVTVIVQAELTE